MSSQEKPEKSMKGDAFDPEDQTPKSDLAVSNTGLTTSTQTVDAPVTKDSSAKQAIPQQIQGDEPSSGWAFGLGLGHPSDVDLVDGLGLQRATNVTAWHLKSVSDVPEDLRVRVRKHVSECTRCASRVTKLKAVTTALKEVRQDNVVHVRWAELDDRISREADLAAKTMREAHVRGETFPRQTSSTRELVPVGAMLAIAAAGIFALGPRVVRQLSHTNTVATTNTQNLQNSQQSSQTTLAHQTNNPENPQGSGNGIGVPSTNSRGLTHVDQPVPSIVPTVLLVAGGVSVQTSGGTVVRANLASVLSSGTRLNTPRRGGRLVAALPTRHVLDVRPGSDLTLDRMDSERSEISVHAGETRIDSEELPNEELTASVRGAPTPREANAIEASNGGAIRTRETTETPHEVTIHAAGWTLHAARSAFLAKVTGDRVTVRVMRGKVGFVSNEMPGNSRDANEGEEVELDPHNSITVHSLQNPVDPDALDVRLSASLRSDESVPLEVPSAPEGSVLDVPGLGSLPGNLRAIRTRVPMTMRARLGANAWTLTLNTTNANLPSAGLANGSVGVGSVAENTTGNTREASWRAVSTSQASQLVVATTTTNAQATQSPIDQQSPVPGENQGVRTIGEARERFTQQAASCFSVCSTRSTGCVGTGHGYVSVDTEQDGQVSAVRVAESLGDADVRQCLERLARNLSLPRSAGATTLHFWVQR